ncbi:MAG: O-antigen ligase family protein [Desulfobacteraceae bacterium]|nr:O-antigen ligase family protein [Desulfobacteraceae bacterium]
MPEPRKHDFAIHELLMVLGLALVIFSIPLDHTKSIELIGIALAFVGWLWHRFMMGFSSLRDNPLLLPLGLFFITIIISFFFCLDIEYSFKNLYREFLSYTVLFFVAVDLTFNKKNLPVLILLFLASNIASILIYLFQFYANGFVLEKFLSSFAIGEFLSIGKSHGATYFLFAAIFSFTAFFHVKKPGVFLLISTLTALNFFMLFVADQRGALLGLLFALVLHFALFKNDRRKFIRVSSAVSICTVIFIFATPIKSKLVHEDWSKIMRLNFSEDYTRGNDSTQIRVFGVKYFWEYLKEHPFTGVGYGRKNIKIIEERFQTIEKFDISDAHNVFVNMAVFLGLQGLLAFTYLVWAQFKTVWRAIRIASDNLETYFLKATLLYMTAFFVRIQFSDMYRHGSAFNFWIILGMAVGLALQYRASSESAQRTSGDG